MRASMALRARWCELGDMWAYVRSVKPGSLWPRYSASVHELKTERQLTSNTLFDLVKVAFAIVAGVGGLVALVVSYRRQRIDEAGALREATKAANLPAVSATRCS